jgi:hypothetical protein
MNLIVNDDNSVVKIKTHGGYEEERRFLDANSQRRIRDSEERRRAMPYRESFTPDSATLCPCSSRLYTQLIL